MKHIVFSLLLLMLPVAAKAGCIDIAELETDRLHIDISDGGCGPLAITFGYKLKNGGRSEAKSFPFEEECVPKRDKAGATVGFSCHAKGRTPLAGATYRRKRFGSTIRDCGELGRDMVPDHRFVCVSGCASPAVPKLLHEKLVCD
jgi:hypothetical protein